MPIVLASVLAHLDLHHPPESCFLNRNSKASDDPDIARDSTLAGSAGTLPVSKLAFVTLLHESGRSEETERKGSQRVWPDVPRISSCSAVSPKIHVDVSPKLADLTRFGGSGRIVGNRKLARITPDKSGSQRLSATYLCNAPLLRMRRRSTIGTGACPEAYISAVEAVANSAPATTSTRIRNLPASWRAFCRARSLPPDHHQRHANQDQRRAQPDPDSARTPSQRKSTGRRPPASRSPNSRSSALSMGDRVSPMPRSAPVATT